MEQRKARVSRFDLAQPRSDGSLAVVPSGLASPRYRRCGRAAAATGRWASAMPDRNVRPPCGGT